MRLMRGLCLAAVSVVVATACGSTSGDEDVVFTSRINRYTGFELCERGAFACRADPDLQAEVNAELVESVSGSFDAAIVEIACAEKRLDFDPPEVDIAAWLGGEWADADPFGSGLVCTDAAPAFEVRGPSGESTALLLPSHVEWHVAVLELDHVVCAGTRYVRPTDAIVLGPAAGTAAQVLVMPDGGRVEMQPVVGVLLDVTDCFELRGDWVALGGGLDGESGTFTRVWDSLQYQVILERD